MDSNFRSKREEWVNGLLVSGARHGLLGILDFALSLA